MCGFILCYGLFWRREEVNWTPGTGVPHRLLGRQGINRPRRVADFWEQTGIYILYGNCGVYYVGRTIDGCLGDRLRRHNSTHHEDTWDRFSWFGFSKVLKREKVGGVCELRDMAQNKFSSPEDVIVDTEALLIRAMEPRNENGYQRVMSFTHELDEETSMKWEQVGEHEVGQYLNED